MKYKASEIISRALQLADLTNTDFISNEENIYYLNDAWREFYQLLINKGDTQFVKQVSLSGNGEYALPDDLYQIHSIRSSNGTIITRRADSEAETSGTYEIINNHLKVYSSANNLIMTYWTVPEWITVPDRTIVTDLVYPLDAESSILNSYLSDGTIRNLITGEVVATDVSGTELIGNKLILDNLTVKDFSGNSLGITYPSITEGYLIDSKNQKWLNTGDNTYQWLNQTVTSDNGGIIVSDGTIVTLPEVLTAKSNYKQYYRNFGNHEFFYLDGYVFEYFNEQLQNYEEVTVPGQLLFVSKYGPVYYDGDIKIQSGLPDTEFNFPNELYIQVLAAAVAVRYAMKQNANVEGLNNLYENMKGQFLNSLSQTGYTRITNVY